MPQRPVVLFPNPLLREKCPHVTPGEEHVQQIVQDLWDTLDSHQGVGLAAPQIGYSARALVVDATRARRPVPNHGRLALLNPKILLAEGQIRFREGCLSVPDLVAHVTRAEHITVAAVLPTGEPLTISAEGFEAVILQHEIDHLDGMLFVDRVRSARDIKPRVKQD